MSHKDHPQRTIATQHQPRSGQSPAGQGSAADREAAANVIRGQIAAIYSHDPLTHGVDVTASAAATTGTQPKSVTQDSNADTPTTTEPTPPATQGAAAEPQNPYHRTHQTNFDFSQYHTAWQQYYQEYYKRYYSQQAQLGARTLQAAGANPGTNEGTPDPIQPHQAPARFGQLKNDLLGTIAERAQAVRRSHHFIPVVSAVVVVALFLFLQYNRVLVAEVKAYVSPGSAVSESDTILVDPTATSVVDAAPRIVIPKINVNIPVVYDEPSMKEAAIQKALERGVVHYNIPGANSVPGQAGNTVIGGRSTNDVFDAGSYKFAFLLLERLQPGDIFYLHYNGTRYIYRVTEKKVIMPSEISAVQANNGKPMAVLVTCTPTGTAEKRLLVFGEQISPDPNTAPVAAQPESSVGNQSELLPGYSQTFFERIKDFFF